MPILLAPGIRSSAISTCLAVMPSRRKRAMRRVLISVEDRSFACGSCVRYRQQTSPGPAPRPFVWTAQVAVVGQGVGSSAPLIIAPSPVARHTVATILARGFSHLLGRRGGGFIRVADCRRRYDRTCSVRGIEGCRR